MSTVSVAAQNVRTIAIVGTGVIGGGWAAHFLRMGYDVVAWDPGAGAEEHLSALVAQAWPALIKLGLRGGASQDRLTFAESLGAALEHADFVQESSPEVLDSKVTLLAEIDRLTPPGVVVGSSTSGLCMSQMAVACETPERFVVGHPFNPPYLLPIVEIVAGEKTSTDVVQWATEFYNLAGKKTLTMDREVSGFVGNRLQEAMWREALHMIESGDATAQQIDDAITHGPGMRWALMGPILTYHVGGGHGGMAHLFEKFGPTLLEPWTRLDAPELTPELRDTVVGGANDVARGRTVGEWERIRDAFLVDLLVLLDEHRQAIESQTTAALGNG